MTDVNINTTGLPQTWGVGGTDASQKAQKLKTHGIAQDSIEMGTLLRANRSYVQDPKNPALPLPNPNASDTPPKQRQAPPTYQSIYQEKFASNMDAVASDYGLSPDQVKSMVFKHYNPGESIDSKLEGHLAEVEGKVSEALKEMAANGKIDSAILEVDNSTGELIPPKGAAKTYNRQMSEAYSESFETSLAALAEKENLTPEQVGKIRFAHFNPGKGDPAIQELLNTAEANALAILGENYSLPDGFAPKIDAEMFNYEISSTYSEEVEAAILAYGEQNGLSETEMQSMIYLHNHPGADVPNAKTYAPILEKIEADALGKIAGPNGLPSGFTPELLTWANDAAVVGEFGIMFEENLRGLNLPSDQLAQVRAAIADPAVLASSSDEIKGIIESTWNQTIGEVQAKLGLPVDWQPIGGMSVLKSGNSAALTDTFLQATEFVNLFRSHVESMPSGGEKGEYMAILKLISDALSSLRKLIATMQGLDTEVASKVSDAQLQAELTKIDEKVAKQKEIDEKMKKMESLEAMGPFGEFLKVLFMILLAPLMIMMMGVILAAAMVAVIVADAVIAGESEDGKGLFSDMFTAISDAMPDTPLGRWASSTLQFLTVGVFALSGNWMLVQKLLFEDSTVLKELAMSAGANEEQADAFNMAMQMIATVAEIIITTALTAGLATGGTVAKAAASTAMTAAKVAAAAAPKAANAVKIVASATKTVVASTAKIAGQAAAKAGSAATKAANAALKAARAAEAAAQIGGKTAKVAAEAAETAAKAAQNAAKFAELAAQQSIKAIKLGGDAGAKAAKTAAQFAQKSSNFAGVASRNATKATEVVAKSVQAAAKATRQFNASIEKLPKLMQTVSKKARQLMQFVERQANTMDLGKIEKFSNILESVTQGWTSLTQIPKNLIQADIALKRGALEAQDAETAELIALMKKFINMLYKMIGNNADWYQQVGSLQQKMLDDKSNVLSRLTNI